MKPNEKNKRVENVTRFSNEFGFKFKRLLISKRKSAWVGLASKCCTNKISLFHQDFQSAYVFLIATIMPFNAKILNICNIILQFTGKTTLIRRL